MDGSVKKGCAAKVHLIILNVVTELGDRYVQYPKCAVSEHES
jgi:hypothetical protein